MVVVQGMKDASVSALVKKYLHSLNAEGSTARTLKQEQEALIDSLWKRHPGFTASENLPRDSLYECR